MSKPSKKPGDLRRTRFLIVTALVFLTWLVFWQTVQYDFVNFDDETYVYGNSHVAAGLSLAGAGWAFTHTVSHNWHPLTVLSHMLDCRLVGLQPWWPHLLNVVLHTTSVVLLFLLLSQATGTLWRSAFVAAVFAVHPLRAESVVWIAQRKDVLSAVLFMLTIWVYFRYVRVHRASTYLAVCGLFALGLMAKPMLVTLPFVLLLLDYWPLNRVGKLPLENRAPATKKILTEKIPLFILSGAGCIATLLAQRKGINPIEKLSLFPRLSNALVSCVVYLSEFVWPKNLAVFYPHPAFNLSIWQALGSFVALSAGTAAVIVLRRKYPHLFVGWFWYLIMLLPVIGIVQVGIQAHADRYTYLPEIGLCVAATWTIPEASTRQGRVWMALAAAVLIAALAWQARIQSSYWQNSETLWTHTAEVTASNDTARNARWDALLEHNHAQEVIQQTKAALHQNPDDADAYNGLATALLRQGRFHEAEENFKTVLEKNPGRPRTHYNIATALLGQNRVSDAIAELEDELQLQPNFAEAENNLGTALLQKGEFEQAILHLTKAAELNPTGSKIHYNLAMAFLKEGNADAAIAQFREELRIQPNFAAVHSDLGIALSQKGQVHEAIAEWQKAIALQPDNLNAACNLAWVLATSPDSSVRDGSKAIEFSERATNLSGHQNPRILRLLAAAYAEQGRFEDAARTAEEALNLSKAQGDADLVNTLEQNIALFRNNSPLRDTSESNR